MSKQDFFADVSTFDDVIARADNFWAREKLSAARSFQKYERERECLRTPNIYSLHSRQSLHATRITRPMKIS